VSHTGATDGLNQSLLDDTVLDVQGQLAGTLLGSTPTHTVGVCGDVRDLLCHYPFALFGNGSGTVLGALSYGTHVLHFSRIKDVIVHLFYLLLK
jgi:hypothetical protein